MKQNKVTVSAPGKLMLLGEHAVVYNHPCLVTAVDQRMRATVETLDVLEFQLEAIDVNVTGYKKPLSELGAGDIPKGAKFVEIAVKNINDKYPLKAGLRITTTSEFSSKFGFGSSSASTVCVVKAMSELLGLNLTNKEIFDLSYKTVLDIQGKGSGFDVAAAVYGGILYFVTGGKLIEPLEIKSLPLIVGYSGVKADTVTLMNKVKESFANRQDRLTQIYNDIEVLVNKAKTALVKGDLKTFGDLMNENQKYLVELGVSIEKLDNMIAGALGAGAYGAKLSGAGGGDCMIVVYPEDKKLVVEAGIKAADGEVLSVGTNAQGVRVEA
ncbi:MAG: mevalonate kinase [Candidatus Levybacteria bacterium]|nr:mevalonate kinase [Candidatus Levybacteria bacterium]MDZ4228615.1 mevalonate kinase [Candidatus Levybacteria bacterium]